MGIICISRGSYSQGKELAEALAGKLGWQCTSREELVEEAIKNGIAVGKLETLMLKPQRFSERLMFEKEHYQAFATSYLCRRALRSNLVYHGRTGHLLLPGVSHVLRLRVVESLESRINAAMNHMNISWEKARSFVEDVDDDMRRWVRTFYDVDWETTTHYDLIVNLEQMTVSNVAAAMCSMAALPEFQVTPASKKTLEDLYLAAKVRLALARHERTFNSAFRVTSDNGEVLVTYLPRDAGVAEQIPEVVERIEGIRKLRRTMAATNILWIQEQYDTNEESYAQIVELAKRWNAAIDLLRFVSSEDDSSLPEEIQSQKVTQPPRPTDPQYNGGIEEDVQDTVEENEGGLNNTRDNLARDGVAGGTYVACCQADRLLEKLDMRAHYTLVVMGDVFLSKGHAAQVRKSRELASAVHDTLKVPVIRTDELKKTYLFSANLAFKLLSYLLVSICILVVIITNQAWVLKTLYGQDFHERILAALAVIVIVPVFAYCYGSFTKNVLKLLRIE